MSPSKGAEPALFCKFSWKRKKKKSCLITCSAVGLVSIPTHSRRGELGELPPIIHSELSTDSGHDSLLSLEDTQVWPSVGIIRNACRTHPKSASPEHICWWAFVIQGKSWWGVQGHQGRNQPSALCSSDRAEQNGRGKGRVGRTQCTQASSLFI